MATGKVTVSSLAKLKGWLWDTQCVGFGARRQTNSVFFYVRYRHNGAQIVRSIGRNGAWTCDTARREAKRLLGIVASGADPFAQPLASEGFSHEVDRYLERKRASVKPSSFMEVERYLRGDRSLPLHSLRLSQIDRRKVAALLGEIETSSGAVTRNRARSALSAFFNWCITEGLLDANPVTGTAKANEGGSRERVLTQNELRKLWRSLDDGPFSEIVPLLLLTGQRRNEIGHLQWSEIDLTRKLIVLPPARTKNGRRHEVPLSAQALGILERQSRRNYTDFVFNNRGFRNWGCAKQQLDERLHIAPWRLHDLRRTCATGMAELGAQPHIIEAVLNHVSGHKGGVAGIYNRAKYEPEMRSALQRWADYVDKITA